MNAHGVLSAKPVAASAARVGRRSMAGLGQKSVGVNRFAGDAKALKARASVGRRAAQPVALRVVAEKVVGIDLGTTNSAVRARGARARALPDAHVERRLGVFSRRLNPVHRVSPSVRAGGRGARKRPVAVSRARAVETRTPRSDALSRSPGGASEGFPRPGFAHASSAIHSPIGAPHAADDSFSDDKIIRAILD